MSAEVMRVLITGVSGQVGGALRPVAEAGGFAVLAPTHDQLDLARPDSIGPYLDRNQPDMVVNCGAFTAVDRAEQEPDLAFAINAEAPGRMAQWCGRHGRPLIHLSTDYVFPGDAIRPYREEDAVGPGSVYGASKLAGERAVREACARHVIMRTAWVYAPKGKNFVTTMLRLGQDRQTLNVVADQWGCPTAADNIARALCAVLDRIKAGDVEAIAGTYHYVDHGEINWYGFADRIFTVTAAHWGRRPIVHAITTDQYPAPARRPTYSVLDTGKFQKTIGIKPPGWQESLDRVLADIFVIPDQPLR